nr:cytosolic endo-beta-N-acetylglucosaminidase-like [Ciona intestinalis]XP_026694401.1 cytosolic endo-beta-N-acetylglucosaminidase-like [Ciona intestinalis]|eukprot:XP_002125915.3 cytosolic endo-beta-N-acetylglucosaminidase-like [Ciona intestinalis]
MEAKDDDVFNQVKAICEPQKNIHLKVDLNGSSKLTGRSTEDGVPVSLPLNSLEELFAWKANDKTDLGQSFSKPALSGYRKIYSSKVMLCHDMAGGYLDDRFVQQMVGNRTIEYHMSYWSLIDIFVYFSHHFITIPPVGWVNACRTNGVAVLGTFITESTGGYDRCRAIFSSPVVWTYVADQMVDIATFYGFDGWLINIENTIELEMIPDVVQFVSYLTLKMHEMNPDAQVIWYDSVTKDGVLKWQNELNCKNSLFYDACDGIFLNYGWKDSSLEKSLKLAKSLSSVYVGIDVFGRGIMGGGGFNSCDALKAINKYGFSSAIFAPGWVLETLGQPNFQMNNKRFWNLLSPLIEHHPIKCPSGFSTGFNSGCIENKCDPLQPEIELGLQSLMPCVPSKYFSLGFNGKDHFLLVNATEATEQEVVFLFNTDVKEKVLTIKIVSNSENVEGLFAMATNRANVILSESKSRDFTVQYKRVTVKKYRYVHEFIIYCSVSFVASELLAIPKLEECIVFSLSLHPGLQPTPQVKNVPAVDILCTEISWKVVEKSEQFFLLDCTLVFTNSTASGIFKTEILCERNFGFCEDSKKPQLCTLGWSRCSKYRVHNMKVGNPMFGGPNCSVLFQVRHMDDMHTVLGVGNLLVTYSE